MAATAAILVTSRLVPTPANLPRRPFLNPPSCTMLPMRLKVKLGRGLSPSELDPQFFSAACTPSALPRRPFLTAGSLQTQVSSAAWASSSTWLFLPLHLSLPSTCPTYSSAFWNQLCHSLETSSDLLKPALTLLLQPSSTPTME